MIATMGDDNGFNDDELLNARQVAKVLKISVRTLWRLVASFQAPQPVRLGRNTRWLKSAVIAWMRRGCPPLDISA